MSVALVYTGEHSVIDVVVGDVLAIAAVVVVAGAFRLRRSYIQGPRFETSAAHRGRRTSAVDPENE